MNHRTGLIDLIYTCEPDDLPMLVGEIPFWLDPTDPRPAREQLDSNYQHGGGWMPIGGFTLNRENSSLKYPGDPPLEPFAFCWLRDERIVFYPHAWVMILQKDGSFEVCRMD